ELQHTKRLMRAWILSLEPEHRTNRLATNLLRFFRTLQLSTHVTVLRTIVRLDAQPTIRSTVVACYGTDAGSASARASARLESDRCRESVAAVSRPYVSGSPPTTRAAGF